MPPDAQRFHIWTIGCQMNTADSQHVADALTHLGLQPAARLQAADIAVVNTCVVRQGAEDKAAGKLGALKQWKEQKPGRTLALMGCLVGVNPSPALTRRFPYVDVFMPPSEAAPLVHHLQRERLNRTASALERNLIRDRHQAQDRVTSRPYSPDGAASGVTSFVPVVYGCSHACTFCIIPFRRGVERSRPLPDIYAEVAQRVRQGTREVTLLGQIVDRYGYDQAGPLGHSATVPQHQGLAHSDVPDLADLLYALHDIPGLWRLRFLTSHPSYLSDRIVQAVRDLPKVCEHFEVPVQAGNDQVLANMRRGYANADYRNLVQRLRADVPGCSINTDVIVGFCGETDAQFEDTYALLQDLRLDKAHLARYSPRPDTVSARRMADDVPEAVKKQRHRRLDALMQAICLDHNRKLLGAAPEILVEKKHKGKWMGRTRQNKLVFVESERDLLGCLIHADITWAGAWSMQGRLAGIVAASA